MTIPATAHFIWFGRRLPWVHLLAIRSAAARGDFERVILHHEDDLSESPHWPQLERTPGFAARRLDAAATLAAAGAHGPALAALYRRLEQPAARANMVRAAILYREGGVYLDLDTVTVRSLAPLRAEAGAFCGAERIVFPRHVKRSRDPRVHARAALQTALRDVLRRAPNGWRAFRRIERHYPAAVNNAVLGAAPEHPFVADLLARMVALPPARQLVRYALGTHLLQEAVAAWTGADLRVHPPEVFFPLGPEISEHWFRPTRERIDAVLTPRTRVVHWYASVRTRAFVPLVGPEYVRRHAPTQLFSQLAAPFVDGP